MICSKCGKPMPDGALFCPSCGNSCKSKEKEDAESLLPPVPPLFSDSPFAKNPSKIKAKDSKGTGCLVASVIFFILCAVITALLLLGSRASKGPFAPKESTETTSSSEAETSSSTTATESKAETAASSTTKAVTSTTNKAKASAKESSKPEKTTALPPSAQSKANK